VRANRRPPDSPASTPATLTRQEAGLCSHHAVSTLEFEIKRHLDLNVSFGLDRTRDRIQQNGGAVPKQDDFRLILGLGVRF